MEQNNAACLIRFPEGIPGFEETKEFGLKKEDSFLARLEAVDNPEIVFFVIRPQLFFPDYLSQVELGAREIETLEIQKEESVDVWSIITLYAGDLTRSTVNLRAPLLLNAEKRTGIQLILSEESYSPRQPLFAAQEPDRAQNTAEGAVG